MLDKRGQGLSTNAIILIILGLVVLIILVVGFTLWWDKIAPFLQTNNVETIKTSCSVACSTGSTYDFCTLNRTLKADGLPPVGEDNKVPKKMVGNCTFFSNTIGYNQYDINPCSTITCPTLEEWIDI